ncbi:hypothetical protein [Halobellus sp.]|uniref:DUF7261 family protein n=1 Tax=Halobellus sp. TaxID=1979212 RepID=UPI0035D4B257
MILRPDDRGQVVLVAAAVVAVALLAMTAAFAQFGYDADRRAAAEGDVASLSAVDRSLTVSFRAATLDATAGDHTVAWRDRRAVGTRIRASMLADIDRLERSHAERGRSLSATFAAAEATRWAQTRCPSGRGRTFGACRAIDGVVVQERAGRTTPVAAVVRVRIVSPTESSTAVFVVRAVS